MAVIKMKPTSPGQRQVVKVTRGHLHKGEPYARLLPELRRTVRAVVAYGEAGAQIERELKHAVPLVHVTGSFDDVVLHAAELAQPGDAVLLAPACSSFDMFRNYEERGRRFKELAHAVATHG